MADDTIAREEHDRIVAELRQNYADSLEGIKQQHAQHLEEERDGYWHDLEQERAEAHNRGSMGQPHVKRERPEPEL